MDIGFIGLGHMGSGIAANLVKAGHRVTVWNRSRDKIAPLVEAGATAADSPAQAAGGEVVFTMLADDRAVEAVTFDENGILSGAARPLHIGLSTISPALADRLADAHAESGGRYISAPVFGRPQAAAAAQLFVAAAGPADALAGATPLLEAIGQRVFTISDTPSHANVVKLCGNFMITAAIEALAEATTLAAKSGVDKAKLIEVLTGSIFAAPIYKIYGEIIVKEAYRPAAFAAPLGLKDMNLASAIATEQRVPMPLLALVRNQLLAAIATEGEEIDWSGMAVVVTRQAGL